MGLSRPHGLLGYYSSILVRVLSTLNGLSTFSSQLGLLGTSDMIQRILWLSLAVIAARAPSALLHPFYQMHWSSGSLGAGAALHFASLALSDDGPCLSLARLALAVGLVVLGRSPGGMLARWATGATGAFAVCLCAAPAFVSHWADQEKRRKQRPGKHRAAEGEESMGTTAAGVSAAALVRAPAFTELPSRALKLYGVEVEDFDSGAIVTAERGLKDQLESQGISGARVDVSAYKGCVLLMASVHVPGVGVQQVDLDLLTALPANIRERITRRLEVLNRPFEGHLTPEPSVLPVVPRGTVELALRLDVTAGQFEPSRWQPMVWSQSDSAAVPPVSYTWEQERPDCHVCKVVLPAFDRPASLSIRIGHMEGDGHVEALLPVAALVPVLGCDKAAAQAASHPGIGRDLAALIAARGRINELELRSWLEVSEYLAGFATSNGALALTRYIQREIVPELIAATCPVSHRGGSASGSGPGLREGAEGGAGRRDGLPGLSEAAAGAAVARVAWPFGPGLKGWLLRFADARLEASYVSSYVCAESLVQKIKTMIGYFILVPLSLQMFGLPLSTVLGLRGLPYMVLVGAQLYGLGRTRPYAMVAIIVFSRLYAGAFLFSDLLMLSCTRSIQPDRYRRIFTGLFSHSDFLYSTSRVPFRFALPTHILYVLGCTWRSWTSPESRSQPYGQLPEAASIALVALLPLIYVYGRERKARLAFATEARAQKLE